MSALDPIERLRLHAALGGKITVEAAAVRQLLTALRQLEARHEAARRSAKDAWVAALRLSRLAEEHLGRARRWALVGLIWQLVMLGVWLGVWAWTG